MSVIVLIVDDDEIVRFFHKIMVVEHKLSADPVGCRNGMEALDYLDKNCTEKDSYLILLDINMPVMNGWDLLDAIGSRPYRNLVKIVMVTSSVNRSDKEKAKLYDGVIDFIEKPVSDEDCDRLKHLCSMDEQG